MLLRLLVSAFAVMAAVVMPAGAADADPYSPKTPTALVVEVVTAEAGSPVVLSLRVEANSKKRPTGTIELTMSASADDATTSTAAAPWSTTIRYTGGRALLEGPVVTEGGYVVNAAYTPDDDAFAGATDVLRFRVGAEPEGDDEDGGGDDNGLGLLPDTGGPNVLWLVIGLGLVGGGAGAVVVARRRTSTPSPA